MKCNLIAAAVLMTSFSVAGAELLTDREWKFAKTWNAAGNLAKQTDGTYQLENTGNAGSVTMHCGEGEYTITPGKHYQVTVEMTHSNPETKNSLFVALPGARRVRKPELRTPYVTGNLTAIEFIARPDERRLAVYLSLSGTGKSTIKSIRVEEINPGNDIIQRRGINWNFIAAPGAKGSMKRLDDNSLQINKTDGKAHVMGYLTLPFPIKAGRSYRVTMTGTRSAEVKRWGLMSHSGSQKSWPSRSAKGKAGELEKIELVVNTKENDNGLRIYAVLHSSGSINIKSIIVEELSTRKEELGKRFWVANSAGATGKAAKNSDGSWQVSKNQDKGNLVFTHHGFIKVTPGRHYLIEWQVKLAAGQKVNSLTYLPRKPKPRTPWPSGKVFSADGSWQTITQIISAQEGEESMRANLVIYGKSGSLCVKSCSVTEMDDEELKKFSQAK